MFFRDQYSFIVDGDGAQGKETKGPVKGILHVFADFSRFGPF